MVPKIVSKMLRGFCLTEVATRKSFAVVFRGTLWRRDLPVPQLAGERKPRTRRHLFPKKTVPAWNPNTAGQTGTQRIGIPKRPQCESGRARNLILERSSRPRSGRIRFIRASTSLKEKPQSPFTVAV